VHEPNFLMVPGLGLGAEAWAPTIRGLERQGVDATRMTVSLLPGYGEPLRSGDPMDPRGAARRLLATSRSSGADLVLLGHSSSCQVVAHAAAMAPDRVVGLVLVGPTTDPRAATWPRLLRRWVATARHETPQQVPSLVRQYRRTGLRNMLRVMDETRRDSIDRNLAVVRCPVRVLRGRYDRIAPDDWCETLGHSVTLPRGGHMVPFTDGDLVAREVRSFARL
jgi:pimeloyl-ACP methyl ester carboxylesterase